MKGRLLLAKELPNALEELGTEASVQHVIPIMEKLSSDSDDTVRETFSSELDQILLYFYKVYIYKFIKQETQKLIFYRTHLVHSHVKKTAHRINHLPLS